MISIYYNVDIIILFVVAIVSLCKQGDVRSGSMTAPVIYQTVSGIAVTSLILIALDLLCQVIEFLLVCTLLIVKTADRLVHVDGKAYENVHTNKDTDDVERDKVDEDPFCTDHLHIHVSRDHPVINDGQLEKDQIGVKKVVEVVQGPDIRGRIIISDCLIFKIDLATKENHSHQGINVEDTEHH